MTLLFGWAHVFYVDASAHPHLHIEVNGFAALLGAGALLGWIRERGGSLWPVIVAHNLTNIIQVLCHRLH